MASENLVCSFHSNPVQIINSCSFSYLSSSGARDYITGSTYQTACQKSSRYFCHQICVSGSDQPWARENPMVRWRVLWGLCNPHGTKILPLWAPPLDPLYSFFISFLKSCLSPIYNLSVMAEREGKFIPVKKLLGRWSTGCWRRPRKPSRYIGHRNWWQEKG